MKLIAFGEKDFQKFVLNSHYENWAQKSQFVFNFPAFWNALKMLFFLFLTFKRLPSFLNYFHKFCCWMVSVCLALQLLPNPLAPDPAPPAGLLALVTMNMDEEAPPPPEAEELWYLLVWLMAMAVPATEAAAIPTLPRTILTI